MISAATGGLGGPVELSVTTIECAGVERGDGAELVKIPRIAWKTRISQKGSYMIFIFFSRADLTLVTVDFPFLDGFRTP